MLLSRALGALGALHTLPHRHTPALHCLSFNPFHNNCASIQQLIDCCRLSTPLLPCM